MAKPSASTRRLLEALPAWRGTPVLAFEAGAGTVGEVVDRLGVLASLKSEIEVYSEALRAVIVDNAEAASEGKWYRATLSQYETERYDTKRMKAAKKSPAIARWLAKFVTTSSVTKVAVKARMGIGLGEPVATAAE